MNVSCKCSELSYDEGVVGSEPSGIESLSSETREFIDMRSVSSITSSEKFIILILSKVLPILTGVV